MPRISSKIFLSLAKRGSQIPFSELTVDEKESISTAIDIGNRYINHSEFEISEALETIAKESKLLVQYNIAMTHAKATGNYLPLMVLCNVISRPEITHKDAKFYYLPE